MPNKRFASLACLASLLGLFALAVVAAAPPADPPHLLIPTQVVWHRAAIDGGYRLTWKCHVIGDVFEPGASEAEIKAFVEGHHLIPPVLRGMRRTIERYVVETSLNCEVYLQAVEK